MLCRPVQTIRCGGQGAARRSPTARGHEQGGRDVEISYAGLTVRTGLQRDAGERRPRERPPTSDGLREILPPISQPN
jgi:hypothetical protein